MGPKRTPASRAPCLGRPRTQHSRGKPPHPPARRDHDEDGGRAGVGMEEDGTGGAGRGPKPPGSAHPRVRRDIPPARAAPRSPARRLSPEREPGRGQSAGCFGRSEPRGRAGRLQRVRRSHRGSQELQLPPARAEALSYLPPSASAPPGPGALARGRPWGRGLMEAGLIPGPVGGRAAHSPRALKLQGR